MRFARVGNNSIFKEGKANVVIIIGALVCGGGPVGAGGPYRAREMILGPHMTTAEVLPSVGKFIEQCTIY